MPNGRLWRPLTTICRSLCAVFRLLSSFSDAFAPLLTRASASYIIGTQMKCPACNNTMIILEHEQIEIDYCPECCGVWLDGGELELMLDSPDEARRLPALFAENPHPAGVPRKCPICRKKMTEVRVGTVEPPLLIDKCKRHHGLWFDKNELQQAIIMAGSEKVQKIQTLFAGIFGKQVHD
jgi:Zn-finger nucleic acid-binding protein